MVRDGEAGRKYDGTGRGLRFSPDSRHLAYIAARDGEAFVVRTEQGRHYASVSNTSLVFAPDSQRLAYVANDGERILIALDGEELRPAGEDVSDRVVFSPDSKRLAYTAIVGGSGVDRDGVNTARRRAAS